MFPSSASLHLTRVVTLAAVMIVLTVAFACSSVQAAAGDSSILWNGSAIGSNAIVNVAVPYATSKVGLTVYGTQPMSCAVEGTPTVAGWTGSRVVIPGDETWTTFGWNGGSTTGNSQPLNGNNGTYWHGLYDLRNIAASTFKVYCRNQNSTAGTIYGVAFDIGTVDTVHVDNFPATQAVSGTVTANAGTGTLAVHDASPATQAVTIGGTVSVSGTVACSNCGGGGGTVTVSNWPSTQPVSVQNWPSSISGSQVAIDCTDPVNPCQFNFPTEIGIKPDQNTVSLSTEDKAGMDNVTQAVLISIGVLLVIAIAPVLYRTFGRSL